MRLVKPLEELISQNEPGIDLICQWADSAKNHYEILPPSPQRDDVLLKVQVQPDHHWVLSLTRQVES